MPSTALSQASSLAGLLGTVIAPVGLISTTAILLSGYTSKYSSMSDQMRRLTAEYRASATTLARRQTLKRQLDLYHRRITAMWAASALLSVALLAFVGTVLSVILSAHETRLNALGVVPLLVGLSLVATAIGLELYEIGLARLTAAGELEDIFAEEEPPDSQ
jgi:hypothetical protein